MPEVDNILFVLMTILIIVFALGATGTVRLAQKTNKPSDVVVAFGGPANVYCGTNL